MARKFLYFVAICTALVIAGAIGLAMFGDTLSERAFVPSTPFEEQQALADNIYAQRGMWYARPDIGDADNPALWLPKGVEREESDQAAIFFIHPTSYASREHWNAPLGDAEAEERARIFLRGQATAFNHVGPVWAPKYRQATVGALITDKPEGQMAFDVASNDVALAFDQLLDDIPSGKPMILAGHSQGALHLTRLLHDRVAKDSGLANRIVAAYVVGWPVSVEADLPALGLPACDKPDQSGCILSWQSFAEPAEYGQFFHLFDATQGFTGETRNGTNIICTNPIDGDRDSGAPARENLGTMVPNAGLTSAEIVQGAVPARCAGRGFLLIGDPPDLGPYVLPGNNYHVYDYSLFWMNVRADVARRLAAFPDR